MALTPQQIQLESQVKELPCIVKLEKSDEQIIKGQERIQEHLNEVDERLEKGSKTMSDLKEDIKNLANSFTNHVFRQEQMHQEIKSEIKDNKYQDIKNELKEKNEEIKSSKRRAWEMFKIILTGIISIVTGGVLVFIFK